MTLWMKKILSGFAGIKFRLLLSFGCLLGLSVVIVLVSNRGGLRAAEAYRKYTDEYQTLSKFYRSIESAESYAKAYLYDGAAVQLAGYERAAEDAVSSLERLYQAADDEQTCFEYRKLINMVQTYDEVFNDIVSGSAEIPDSYGFFSRLPRNIQATYIQYAEMITAAMNTTYQEIDHGIQRQIAITWGAVAVMMAAAFGGMIFATYSITRPIKKLVGNVGRVKRGEYHLKPVKSTDPQIQLLSRAIVEMADGISENIAYMEERVTLEKMLLIQENEKLRMHKTLAETELKVLQGQMNPHFLFNTLNLIAKMAYLEHAPRASRMMEKTSDLLRYSLEKSTGSANLSGEIECIKNYIEIQKLRMGHRIHFKIEIEEGLPDIVMQGMIIQPIVENAVVHGVSDMMEGARIQLSVLREQAAIVIRVEDNGKGISSDRMEKLLTDMDGGGTEPGQRSSIGVQNVKKRLEMFYGADGMLNLESSENCGTVVTIKIPVAEEGEHVSSDDCRG